MVYWNWTLGSSWTIRHLITPNSGCYALVFKCSTCLIELAYFTVFRDLCFFSLMLDQPPEIWNKRTNYGGVAVCSITGVQHFKIESKGDCFVSSSFICLTSAKEKLQLKHYNGSNSLFALTRNKNSLFLPVGLLKNNLSVCLGQMLDLQNLTARSFTQQQHQG